MNAGLRRRERAADLRDIFVALLCCTAIGLTAYSLYLDETTPLEAGDAAPAGTIDYRQGATHRRYATRAIWESLSPGDVVYNRNSIRTGPSAEALIRLLDDTRIELDQATMVVLELRDNEIRLRLEAGSVEIRRSQPRYQRELNVSRGDHVLEFDSGQVRLEALPESGLQVTPYMGSVTVRESSRQISAGDRMLLSGTSERQSLNVHLLAPEQGERLPADERITLRWKHAQSAASESPGSKTTASAASGQSANRSLVEISSDAAFRQIVERRELNTAYANHSQANQGTLETRLPPGSYYWRVQHGDDASAIGKFRVLANATPLEIIEPTAAMVSLPGNAGRALVPFAWQATTPAARYRLEIFSGAPGAGSAATKPLLVRRVEREYIRVPLPPGEYHFRVHSENGPRSGKSSAPQTLRLQLADAAARNSVEPTAATAPVVAGGAAARLPAPVAAPEQLRLRFPAPAQSVDMSARDALVFRWQALRGAAEYRLKLFALNTGGAPALIYSGTSSASSLRFDRLHLLEAAGQYRWTLSTADGQQSSADFRIVLSNELAEPEFVTEPQDAVPGQAVDPAAGVQL